MARLPPLLLAAAIAALLLFLAWWYRSWGALALLVVASGGFAWYRIQVARTAAAEKFFGDMGEETRLTNFQAGSPSEMPVDRPAPPSAREPRQH
jgi:hypothetical protein